MIDFASLASLAIVGAAVSVLVQLIKNSTVGMSANVTRSIVIGLSILAGTVYHFFGTTAVLMAIVQVLGFANTVYLFLIKPFETPMTTDLSAFGDDSQV